VTIPFDQRDAYLGDKLLMELPGILNWAIEGCLEWRTGGLREPVKVAKATQEYKAESDTLAQFLDACCTIGRTGRTTRSSDVYKAYTNWCQYTGEQPATQSYLTGKLRDRGYLTRKVHGGVMAYDDIHLKNMGDPDDNGSSEF
jgi:putative DNA primase/helicase